MHPGQPTVVQEIARFTHAGNLGLNAAARIYLDGAAAGGHTYLTESSNDVIALYAGAYLGLTVNGATGLVTVGSGSTTAEAPFSWYFNGSIRRPGHFDLHAH
jgi:hypothetical protein